MCIFLDETNKNSYTHIEKALMCITNRCFKKIEDKY